ncbi:unnamed protein product [Coregonus sp. 'balchen']|nr:unnamed protein product [Coregonus sp. 'balchen']
MDGDGGSLMGEDGRMESPNEAALLALMENTGYSMVQENGQRKFGGPPPGSIPKDKMKEEILVEMRKVTEGVVDVIVYPSSTDKTKNRGFAFVEYDSHKAAAMARRKLIPET